LAKDYRSGIPLAKNPQQDPVADLLAGKSKPITIEHRLADAQRMHTKRNSMSAKSVFRPSLRYANELMG